MGRIYFCKQLPAACYVERVVHYNRGATELSLDHSFHGQRHLWSIISSMCPFLSFMDLYTKRSGVTRIDFGRPIQGPIIGVSNF